MCCECFCRNDMHLTGDLMQYRAIETRECLIFSKNGSWLTMSYWNSYLRLGVRYFHAVSTQACINHLAFLFDPKWRKLFVKYTRGSAAHLFGVRGSVRCNTIVHQQGAPSQGAALQPVFDKDDINDIKEILLSTCYRHDDFKTLKLCKAHETASSIAF